MSIIYAEIEYVHNNSNETIRYLEHGWPSDLCRWHSHDQFELHLITATKGRAFIGDYIGDFKEGALFLTGPNLPHNWITDPTFKVQVPIRDMLVQFNLQTMKELFTIFPEFKGMDATLETATFGIEFLDYDFQQAYQYLTAIRDEKGAKRIICFLNFLLSVHDHQDKKLLSSSSIFQPRENSKYSGIAKLIDYVSKNFANDISLNQAVRMTGMSRSTFSQKFQQVTGKKFVEFVNSIRINQACTLLYLSDHLISTICYEVGFQNLSNFNRCFTRLKNMTPSQYRELARSELGKV